MQDISLIEIIIYFLFFFIIIGGYIRNCIDLQKERRIMEKGIVVQGKVEKIIYLSPSRRLARSYYRRPVVSFVWKGSSFTLKTLTTVPKEKYMKGAEVELLYLPEYANKVVIKDEMPTSVAGFVFDSIMLLFFTVAFIVVMIGLLK